MSNRVIKYQVFNDDENIYYFLGNLYDYLITWEKYFKKQFSIQQKKNSAQRNGASHV